ncbi:MAG: hypothetical protein ACLP0J_29190 [Solirubrobacteraceae bacterium]|jgi:hypothetical protein
MRDSIAVLGQLVAADEAMNGPQLFTMTYLAAGTPVIAGRDWPEDVVPPSDVEVDELEDLGWVRVIVRTGKGRQFSVTGEGRRAWEKRTALLAPRTGASVDLSWPAARAVLHQLYEQYTAQGAPEAGIETMTIVGAADDPASTRAAIRELARDG